jgi:hypothetical protein
MVIDGDLNRDDEYIYPSEYIYELMNIEYTCHLLPHGSLTPLETWNLNMCMLKHRSPTSGNQVCKTWKMFHM